MEKQTIKNRKGQDIVVLIEVCENSKGLAFVMHGFSGNKEQPHIATIADALKEKNYSVIRFDTTNTFGESYGKLEDATLTNYLEDLEDVVDWSKKQKWYEEPFILAGHSLGAISIILYAEKFPEKVRALAPLSTVISGKLSLETKENIDLEKWKKEGIREWLSHSGKVKRVKWQHMEDRMKYDVLPGAERLKMPILFVTGEKDTSTPEEHQRILYKKVKGKKEFHVIQGSEHTFRSPEELAEIKKILGNWLDQIS